jgi:hypothetical protein
MGVAIRPSADLRNHYNEKDYYHMKFQLELLKTLAEADDDVKNGRVALIQDSFGDLHASLHETKMMKYKILRTDKAEKQLAYLRVLC